MTLALVQAGGGANGAYEAGVVGYLMGERAFPYKILTGTSVGAMNAAFLAMFKVGQETRASQELFNMWHRLRGNQSVYRDWPMLGKLAALFRPAMFDSSPVGNMIRDNLKLARIKSSGRKLAVVAVSLNSGRAVVFREDHPQLKEGVIGSSAFPAMFIPARIAQPDGKVDVFADGGIRDVTPIKEAIELGATEIHVVIPSPKNPPVSNRKKWTTLDVAMRSLQLMVDEIMDTDLKLAQARNRITGFKKVKIVVVRPTEDLGDSFDFSKKKVHRLVDRGYRDARNCFEGGLP